MRAAVHPDKTSDNKYKHCWPDPDDPNYIICRHHQTGQKIRKKKPPDWDEGKNSQKMSICDSDCQLDLLLGAAVVGGEYLAYRCARLLPSLTPPLWWTLPANLAIP